MRIPTSLKFLLVVPGPVGAAIIAVALLVIASRPCGRCWDSARTVFNDAFAPPQSDVGFGPTPARGRVGRDCEQIIFDTRETLGSPARGIPPLDPMSAKLPVAHVSSPPTSEPELIFMVLKPARINASITCAGVDGPSPRTCGEPLLDHLVGAGEQHRRGAGSGSTRRYCSTPTIQSDIGGARSRRSINFKIAMFAHLLAASFAFSPRGACGPRHST